MKNSFEELYSENNEWTKSKFATYGNAKNTWTGYKNQPQILDYIFYQNSDSANVSVKSADVAFFKVKVSENKYVSVSDHDGVTTTIRHGKCN